MATPQRVLIRRSQSSRPTVCLITRVRAREASSVVPWLWLAGQPAREVGRSSSAPGYVLIEPSTYGQTVSMCSRWLT